MPSVHLRPLARLVALAAVAGAFGLATVASPARAGEPTVAAPSAIVVDAATGERLYARDAEARRPIASTTKLMTALLALERGRPSQVLTSPGYSPSSPDESTIGLRAGEQMTLRDLLRALLLPSANDA